MNATIFDAAELGAAMAKAGFPRETDFIDEDLREAFFRSYDDQKARMAERFSAPVDNKASGHNE